MSEGLYDQFASLSVESWEKVLASRQPSLPVANDASSTKSNDVNPSSNINSGNERPFEIPPLYPPQGTPPNSIAALQEVSPLSTPSADNRRTIEIFKAQGNAKQELHIYFDKHNEPGQQGQLPKKVFVTWDDRKEQHVKRFTCIFVSPEGEVFPSGKLWDARGHSYEPGSNTHWYKNKKEAIEAAAARAIDCLNYRFLSRTGDDRFQFGKEDPYGSDDTQSPPQDLPRVISEQTKQEILSLGGII
jgi:hypothetical protein